MAPDQIEEWKGQKSKHQSDPALLIITLCMRLSKHKHFFTCRSPSLALPSWNPSFRRSYARWKLGWVRDILGCDRWRFDSNYWVPLLQLLYKQKRTIRAFPRLWSHNLQPSFWLYHSKIRHNGWPWAEYPVRLPRYGEWRADVAQNLRRLEWRRGDYLVGPPGDWMGFKGKWRVSQSKRTNGRQANRLQSLDGRRWCRELAAHHKCGFQRLQLPCFIFSGDRPSVWWYGYWGCSWLDRNSNGAFHAKLHREHLHLRLRQLWCHLQPQLSFLQLLQRWLTGSWGQTVLRYWHFDSWHTWWYWSVSCHDDVFTKYGRCWLRFS